MTKKKPQPKPVPMVERWDKDKDYVMPIVKRAIKDPGTWPSPVMRDMDEEAADGHSEIDNQGENDEQDSD